MQAVEIYINGIGCISPQPTFNNQKFLNEIKEYVTNRIYCVDTDYTHFFDAASLRRMSRIVKFGTAAGLIALADAGIKTPHAISTGTGYGLLELSQRFLRDFISSDEGIVSPTAFIQSTHNTVSSNIALLTACHEHNNTFSQKGASFESTLFDAKFLLSEGKQNVLIGTYEEIGEFNYASLVQNNELRKEPCNNLTLLSEPNNGVIVGEGAAFFALEKEKKATTYCQIIDFETHYRSGNIAESLLDFLHKNQLTANQIDLVVSGLNGNVENDQPHQFINNNLLPHATIIGFKHLCGEYMTAGSFAMFLAAQIIKHQSIPPALILRNTNRPIERVLLCNSFKHYHSFFIFEKC
jgi:3-oxoacyl-(acyl-carrier-protein) synthase